MVWVLRWPLTIVRGVVVAENNVPLYAVLVYIKSANEQALQAIRLTCNPQVRERCRVGNELSFDTLGLERITSLRIWMWRIRMRKCANNH